MYDNKDLNTEHSHNVHVPTTSEFMRVAANNKGKKAVYQFYRIVHLNLTLVVIQHSSRKKNSLIW
eukprot:UN07321